MIGPSQSETAVLIVLWWTSPTERDFIFSQPLMAGRKGLWECLSLECVERGWHRPGLSHNPSVVLTVLPQNSQTAKETL